MARFWTCHWQNRSWRNDVNAEYSAVCSSGSHSFRKRGVSVGDVAYVISLADGQLLLGGRMTIKRIVSRDEAVRIWGNERLYPAEEWIIDPEESGTPLNLHRRLAPAVTRRLRFVSSRSGPRGLFFKSETHLDPQATRGIHELTAESSVLLDRIIEITDRFPRSEAPITVTEELLANGRLQDAKNTIRLAEEVPIGSTYSEGSVERILINRYERDPRAREECIQHYGTACFVCGFNFVHVYGEVMAGFTHVHHLNPLSLVGAHYELDPIDDLRPVCPNCHAVLHRREPPYSLDEVRPFLEGRRIVEGESHGA
ncbi:MAG: HNH endonuclease [Thermoguttaceae bacterium]|jgi:5-methylcytosine-specific restriction endonuclease McrA